MDRRYRVALALTLGLCVALTLAHLAYVLYAYPHSSIIYFIGKELW